MGWGMMKCDAVGKVERWRLPMGYIYCWSLHCTTLASDTYHTSEHGPLWNVHRTPGSECGSSGTSRIYPARIYLSISYTQSAALLPLLLNRNRAA